MDGMFGTLFSMLCNHLDLIDDSDLDYNETHELAQLEKSGYATSKLENADGEPVVVWQITESGERAYLGKEYGNEKL